MSPDTDLPPVLPSIRRDPKTGHFVRGTCSGPGWPRNRKTLQTIFMERLKRVEGETGESFAHLVWLRAWRELKDPALGPCPMATQLVERLWPKVRPEAAESASSGPEQRLVFVVNVNGTPSHTEPSAA